MIAHNRPPNLTLLETLESRIAPAVLFMGTDGSIKDSTGNAVATDPTNSIVGADSAVLLKKGDRLVLDADNNLKAAKTEKTLFSVSTGAAVLYLNNLPGGLPMDISGVATTGAFRGASGTDIFGDIATVLNLQGKGKTQTYSLSQTAQALNLVPGTGIEGFTINGFVDGSMVSGGRIDRVGISGSLNDGLSVVGLRTGTGANDLNTLDLGGKIPLDLADFTPAVGADGGRIFDVSAKSISLIAAGDGGSGAVNAGAGGMISAITIYDQNEHALTLKSGAGGSPDGGKSGEGKAGGWITRVNVQGFTSDLTITTGKGGAGDSGSDAGPGGSGGAGGSVLDVGATVLPGKLTITTGAGGDAGTPFSDQTVNKPGGAGGSIEGLSIFSGATASVEIQLGDSGAGGGNVSGGSISSSEFRGELSEISIIAGNGGDSIQGLSGASGGSIGGWNKGLTIDAEVSGTLKLVAGNGGATSAIFDSNLGNLKAVGTGGDGGQIAYGRGSNGATSGSLYLQTGDAGSGALVGTAGAAYGFSGSFGRYGPDFYATGEVTLITGHGADGARFASPGGSVQNLMIVGSKISITTGEGGTAGAIDAFKGDSQISRTAFTGAGNGGFIKNLSINGLPSSGSTVDYGSPDEVSLVTGAGGDAAAAVSWKYNPAKDKTTLVGVMDGGDAGYVNKIEVSAGPLLDQAVTSFTISTGTNIKNAPHAGGGDGGQQDTGTDVSAGFRQAKPTGFGGDGGYISNVTAAVKGQASFTTADGGKSGNMLFNLKSKFGPGPSGGLAGEIARASLQGFAGSSLDIKSGKGGSGLSYPNEGGLIHGVVLTGAFDSVELTAGDGADGRTVEFPGFESAGGTRGGDGGRANLHLDGTIASLVLKAGNGGAEAPVSLFGGGRGGSINGGVSASPSSIFGDVILKAGDGTGGPNGSGLGGDISRLDLKVSGQVTLESGASGQPGSSGSGGFFSRANGGGVSDITFRADGESADVTIISSDGSDEANETWAGLPTSPNYGYGGSGGWISGIKFTEGAFAGVTLQAGKGGEGAIFGGNGGLVTAISLASAASVDSFVIKAGDGGDGTIGGPANGSKSGHAGAGGSISGEKFSLLGAISSLAIEGGDGGDSLTGIGSGGKGGDISKIASIIASGGNLQLKAGTGGSSGGSPLRITTAGSGGSLQDIIVSGPLPGALISSIVLQAGVGGDGSGSASSFAGSGGSVTKFVSTSTVADSIDIFAGDGGDSLLASTGGNGGSLSDIAAIYSNTSAAMVGSGGIGIAPGEDGTQTNVVVTHASNEG